ncbi:hypothetical protein RF11_11608 [Thelohanellus kitauei]|uniref:Uncharacterized protein n=1 Tax=Thelohanellus kitauei TaxID=669202 RepID=A0A0C2IKI8_THEKT|nr:hypothetical protein RF11_11608 [Thelohanellus kitauei]
MYYGIIGIYLLYLINGASYNISVFKWLRGIPQRRRCASYVFQYDNRSIDEAQNQSLVDNRSRVEVEYKPSNLVDKAGDYIASDQFEGNKKNLLRCSSGLISSSRNSEELFLSIQKCYRNI